MADRLLSIQELAKRWGVPESWLYERSRHNALPGMIRLGKYVRFSEEAIIEYELQQTQTANPKQNTDAP